MRQRVCIAMALANDPKVLIADEPTTALDVTVQAQVLSLMDRLRRERDSAILFITHDFGVVSAVCDRVAVMYAGQIVETGPTAEVLAAPAHPYTDRLIACVPVLGAPDRRRDAIHGRPPAVNALPRGCAFADRCPRSRRERCAAPPISPLADGGAGRADRSLPLRPAGVAREGHGHEPRRPARRSGRRSWSRVFGGGRTLARQAAAPPVHARCDGRHASAWDSGETLGHRRRIRLRQVHAGAAARPVDWTRLPPGRSGWCSTGARSCAVDGAALTRLRGWPAGPSTCSRTRSASLNPRNERWARSWSAPLAVHAAGACRPRRASARAWPSLLAQVGLAPGARSTATRTSFPAGSAQRIGIARALAPRIPQLLVGDEPVSALDVWVQAQVLNLLADLKVRLGLTYGFISHDLSVVESVCDRVAVMYFGRVVEVGPVDAIFNRPRHPYTRLLLDSVPVPGRKPAVPEDASTELPDPYDPPPGCAFRARCPWAVARCATDRPALDAGAHKAACWEAPPAAAP